MTEKSPKPPPPWRSGFCNPSNDRASHLRCPGSYNDRPCVCDCHVRDLEDRVIETPQLGDPIRSAVLEAAKKNPVEKVSQVPTGAWSDLLEGLSSVTLSEDDLAALREHRGASIAELGQAFSEQRLTHQAEFKRTGDSIDAGWVDAMTWAMEQIMYRRPRS